MKNNKRILIFNVNWLGDVLFSTAVIRNIRYNFPESFISCIVPSSCHSILKDNPRLDEIIVFDEKDRHRGITAKLRFIRLLKGKRFDTVFLLHRSFSRALICFLAGIPDRVGYRTKKRTFLLTKKFTPPKPDTLHRIDYYLNIIEHAGLKIEDRYPEFFVSQTEEEFIDAFLTKNALNKPRRNPADISGGPEDKSDFLIVVNPGGNWLPKRWPEEYWAKLSDELIAGFGARVILTGSHKDAGLASAITGLMKERPVIASGSLNLKQLGALCKRADLFISADSGPLHIANAVNTKHIIALFGPTDPLITGPFPLKNVRILAKNTGCKIPCYVVNCKDNRCMKAIKPDEVLGEIKLLMAAKTK